jgi:hypothetical protein
MEGFLRVLTLEDIMRIFYLPDFTMVLYKLNTLVQSHGDLVTPVTNDQLKEVKEVLVEALEFCKKAGFARAMEKVDLEIDYLGRPATLTSPVMSSELRHVLEALEREMFDNTFVHVLADRMNHINQVHLFGEAVTAAFPSAEFDIREAGNCLAVESNVAAIYHLMCAVEYGLRAVAWDRRVNFPKGPIEFQQWGDILRELGEAVLKIQQWPKNKRREAAHEFYNHALLEIRSFNDAYRRHVMHSRERNYNRDDALGIMNHVRDFMQLLATRISETKRTPSRWQGLKL